MTRHILRLSCTLALTVSNLAVTTGPAMAYSYAVEETEPLLDGREVMFQAADSGFWMAARISFDAMRTEIEYLDQNEDPGLMQSFEAAVSAKDAAALRTAFTRAAADEIIRRMDGAKQNLDDYETAKLLVVAANRFYISVAADLDPTASQVIAEQMPIALDAIGNPGVFGLATRAPDPGAFDAARVSIAAALGHPAQ